MLMVDEQQQGSPFVRSMSIRVARRATACAAEVDQFLAAPPVQRRRTGEQHLLDLLNRNVESLVAQYDPPSIRRNGDSLVFGRVYAAVPRSVARGAAVPAEILAALLAAEVEYRGPLRLSRAQNRQLAEVYERLGTALAELLPGHAALAFRRGGSLYRQDEDTDGEDRCSLNLARSRRRAQPAWLRRVGGWFPDLLCGYGYRPYRILIWVLVQVIACAIVVRLLSTESTLEIVYDCCTNFLNPLGPGDTAGLEGGERFVFVAEAYGGTLTTSVFFALMVRRWFRT